MDGTPHWGVVQNDTVRRLDGDPYDEFTVGPEVAALSETHLLAPCKPSKVVCAGRNYHSLLLEQGRPVPAEPFLFLKASTAVVGPHTPVLVPPGVEDMAHEGELALVIAAETSGVTPAQAEKSVLGYTCANDITVRDWQSPNSQWWRAKSSDSHCPIGPWIACALPSPGNVQVRTFVDGELRQSGRTDDLVFGISALVSYISRTMTLLPGDVVLTGTPAGIRPVHPGEVMEVEVEGIGRLINPVASWPPEAKPSGGKDET